MPHNSINSTPAVSTPNVQGLTVRPGLEQRSQRRDPTRLVQPRQFRHTPEAVDRPTAPGHRGATLEKSATSCLPTGNPRFAPVHHGAISANNNSATSSLLASQPPHSRHVQRPECPSSAAQFHHGAKTRYQSECQRPARLPGFQPTGFNRPAEKHPGPTEANLPGAARPGKRPGSSAARSTRQCAAPEAVTHGLRGAAKQPGTSPIERQPQGLVHLRTPR